MRDPFGTQGGSKTQTGPRRYLGVPPFLALSGRTWSLQGPILDPRGDPKKGPKSTWGGKVGTFGGQGGPKGSSKGGPKMGSKKLSKRGPKMRAFGMAKTFKNVVRYCKIQVLRVSEKYQKYVQKWFPKWVPKCYQMEPLGPQGRPRSDFAPPWVDFEGSPKWVDF